MRILYGVVGEGMGHAIRSSVILEHLRLMGHDMRIVASGRAVNFLNERHPDVVIPITGLSLVYRDNMVSTIRTAIQNIRSVTGVPSNVLKYLQTAQDFQPDVVITDFESWSYWFARGTGVPVISVDNMQIINRCSHPESMIQQDARSFQLARNIVRAKVPKCNAFMITTFFFPPVSRERTTLHPPILRPRILEAKDRVSTGSHVLVYQTGTSHQALIDELKQVDVPFRVYGLLRDIQEDHVDHNLTFRPFSQDGFVEDLATCSSVISGGGFTLMGEAVFLGKPMLSIPVSNQFEQVLNARYLEALEFGQMARHVTAEGVGAFLSRRDRYAEKLQSFEHDRNAGFVKELEGRMTAAVAEGSLSP